MSPLARAPASAPAAPAASTSLDAIHVTGSRLKAEDEASITNNQVQGVDEGDIVKRRADLPGYEMVEGRIDGERITERRRMDFTRLPALTSVD